MPKLLRVILSTWFYIALSHFIQKVAAVRGAICCSIESKFDGLLKISLIYKRILYSFIYLTNTSLFYLDLHAAKTEL